MSKGDVLVGNLRQRPSFRYAASGALTWDECQAQMAESSRNVLESIHAEVCETNRLLRRMDRRMARAFPLSGPRRK